MKLLYLSRIKENIKFNLHYRKTFYVYKLRTWWKRLLNITVKNQNISTLKLEIKTKMKGWTFSYVKWAKKFIKVENWPIIYINIFKLCWQRHASDESINWCNLFWRYFTFSGNFKIWIFWPSNLIFQFLFVYNKEIPF